MHDQDADAAVPHVRPRRSNDETTLLRRPSPCHSGSMRGATTEKIRAWALSLPEVTEKQHHLFKVPVWQVRGKTFLGMGRDETTVVFCVTEESANAWAAADPTYAAAVRRKDARRSFLGLEVRLAGMPPERIEAWVHEAWTTHAPKRLISQHTA
jgi:hypothetical protein